MKKIFYLLIPMLLAFGMASAQVIKAELQVAGLTCSMCSRATDKQLRTLDFIDSVGIDLSHASFMLYFKEDKPVDFQQIQKKVEDAGFSVASLKVAYRFDGVKAENGASFSYNNSKFLFINTTPKVLSGVETFSIIDKGFLSPKEFKKYAGQAVPIENTYHITL